MKVVSICGAFRLDGVPKGGQEVKTHIFATELENKNIRVYKIDTIGRLNIFLLTIRLFYALVISDDIIILPAQKGLRIEACFLFVFNVFFKRNIHYITIGGWLHDYLRKNKFIVKILKTFKGIYVETESMNRELKLMGFTNTCVLPNCKPIKILNNNELKRQFSEPLNLVVCSRITKQKGIEDAVDVVNEINSKNGAVMFKLDIFGPIDDEDFYWFESLQKKFTTAIKYKGCIPFLETSIILSEYFMLLFPTKYYTEGVPGTIIDSFSAGVPVLGSKWFSFSDVVEVGKTGLGFEFDNVESLKNQLLYVYKNKDKIIEMRESCIKKASDYSVQNVFEKFLYLING